MFILSYLLGGSHFLLSLQPTTTGVILSLYFIVNVRPGSEESKWIDQLVVKHVLGGGLGLGNE